MRKRFIASAFIALFASSLLVGCNSKSSSHIYFEKSEYTVSSGDSVTVKGNPKGVTYSFANYDNDNLKVEENTGKITFSDIPNYTQVLYTAKKDNYVTDPVVLTLVGEIITPTLEFVDTTDYICNGNYIYAVSSTNSSIAYKVINAHSGITINRSSGLVHISNDVEEGTTFTVVISSNGVTNQKTFTVVKNNLVTPKNDKQVTEVDDKIPVCFELDFDNVETTYERIVKKVINGHNVLGEDTYTYNPDLNRLTLSVNALAHLNIGENIITIVTSKNMVNVTVILATKIVKTAQDLANINKDVESLSGYYVLGNDVDLTEYLSKGGEGYNSGKGWTPIGLYHDVLDGTAYKYTFKGTFDGNGYTVSGLYMNRTDEYGFNAGLFGYVYNIAVIKNLKVVSDPRGIKVASFSGAIAGVNEGVISNCVTDVDVSNNYGGNSYHIVGGFVGRNIGSIDHSIALGKVDGEAEIGAFVGLNEGEITYSYSTKESYEEFGTGLAPVNSKLYENLAELGEDRYNLDLDETYWNLEESVPELKHYIDFYFPYSLLIVNENDEYIIGDVITVEVMVYPESLLDVYKDDIVITTNDENVTIDGFDIDTENIVINELIVKATLSIEGIVLECERQFHIYEKTETLQIVNDFENTSVEPGKSYQLTAEITPEGASKAVSWSLYSSSAIIGIEIEGDILNIDESVENYSQNDFKVIAKSGGLTSSLTLKINRPIYLNTPTQVLYSDDIHDVSYIIPGDVDLENAKLYRFNQEIEYTLNDNIVTINKDYVTEVPNTDILFKLVLSDGSYYRFYANYITHEKYQLINLPADVYEIATVEDFNTYFNILNSDDPVRYRKYYSKTFYLSEDIDFEGQTIYGIGYQDEESGTNRQFTGKFYGFNHTIKNAVINDSERYLVLTDSERNDPYRSSKYGVGFFGALNGEVYDVIFDNISVIANSWNGGFAGTMSVNAIAENIHFINSVVRNSNDVSYSTSENRTGKFTALNEGRMTACSFNGSIIGLIGEKI